MTWVRSEVFAVLLTVATLGAASCSSQPPEGSATNAGGGASGAATGGASAGAAGVAGRGGAVGSGGAGGGGASGDGALAGSGGGVVVGNIDAFSSDPSVSVLSMVYELGASPLLVLPNFPFANGSVKPSCTPVRIGDCIVDNCTGLDPNASRLSAGTITVDSPAAGIHIAAIDNGQGYSSTTGDKAFGGGEAVTVSASGGDIPAFSLSMQVPLMLLIDQPTVPTLTSTTVAVQAPRAAPLTLTWKRGAPGVFLVVQSLDIQGFGGLGAVNARCFFDSTTGTGTVPAAVLSDVEVGQEFVLLTASATVAQAGTQSVTVWLGEEALTPDKMEAVVLQAQ
jgi:hypothetical protein